MKTITVDDDLWIKLMEKKIHFRLTNRSYNKKRITMNDVIYDLLLGKETKKKDNTIFEMASGVL